ncbi:unnamed protein product [Zymoseptoria tritici ST99CH_3D1]|nr:unnamed protein product [Zymoseptoria tritici ST99CH_3D1]
MADFIQSVRSPSAEALIYEDEAEKALDNYYDEVETDRIAGDQHQPGTEIRPANGEGISHVLPSPVKSITRDQSEFTYRDLRLMGQSATNSPLRVIALIDFDAFYAQCETVRLELPADKPLAVQQWRAIIALNYPARDHGLKRGMPVDEVKRLCPSIHLQHVATWREGEASWAYRSDQDKHMSNDKAALEPYRIESRKAFALIESCLPVTSTVLLEKASIDEMYLDLSTYVHDVLLDRYPELLISSRDTEGQYLPLPPATSLDWQEDNILGDQAQSLDWDAVAMNIGAGVIRELRHTVHSKLHYTASAGIASNKMLAKLGAGCKKPNNQTILRTRDVPEFLSSLKYKKIRGLGGQLGTAVEEAFNVTTVADLLPVSLKQMQTLLGADEGTWIYNVIRGREHSEVSTRKLPQSMLSQKTFTPAIANIEKASHWLRMFAAELYDRVVALDTPTLRRRPRTLAVNHHINGRFGPTRSRQATISTGSTMSADLIYELASSKLREISAEAVSWPCAALGVVLSNFVELDTQSLSITTFFKPGVQAHCEDSMDSQAITNKRRASLSLMSPSKATRRASLTAHQERPSTDCVAAESSIATCDAHYQCPTCNAHIAELDVLEHLDWHVAMDLQGEG